MHSQASLADVEAHTGLVEKGQPLQAFFKIVGHTHPYWWCFQFHFYLGISGKRRAPSFYVRGWPCLKVLLSGFSFKKQCHLGQVSLSEQLRAVHKEVLGMDVKLSSNFLV